MKLLSAAVAALLLACAAASAATAAPSSPGSPPTSFTGANAPLQTAPPSVEAGSTLSQVPPSAEIYDPNTPSQSYVLGPGDSISVTVTPQSKYGAASVPVTQDGTIDYPQIGVIQVQGMTLADLTTEIQKRLSVYCVNPDVTVTLLALRPQVVYISGGVADPKVVDVHAAQNVVKAITLAGGPNDRYELSHVAIVRGDKVLTADVYPLYVNGIDNGQNLALEPGDLVLVPTNTAKVTVIGAVGSPGSIPLDETGVSQEGPMRLADALSRVGGPRGSARVGKISLMRQVPGQTTPQITTYDYGKFLQNGDVANNPVLQDNDVIVVPDRKGVDTNGAIAGASILSVLAGVLRL
jgi:polysaccharide export outer membrane protein